MRTLTSALLYVVGALVLGALLSYPLYLMLSPVVELPFHRVVSRAALVTGLIALPIFAVHLGVASREALGFGLPARPFISRLLAGWLLGTITLLPLVVVLLALQVRVPAPEAVLWSSEVLHIAARGLASGLLIGIVEETLFRGGLYAAVARRNSVTQAIIWSSLFYAALHFVKPAAASWEALSWTSGLASLVQGLARFAEPGVMADSFVALLVAGVLLALVRRDSGHIAYCIGVHAGWVMVIRVTKHFTDRSAEAPLGWLVGSYDGVIGWLAAAWLGVLCLAYEMLRKYRRRRVGEA
ncbi:MAG: type II CAAX endopeptidase family protein [Gammaproteobacteria bacterium]|nr:type II CAAX endopeptidase family protein [Gammaproteobacteria bacterium]